MSFDFLSLNNPATQTVLFLVGGLLVWFVLVRLGIRVVDRYVKSPTRRYQATRTLRRIGLGGGVILLLLLLSPASTSLVNLLTIAAAGLAIALRELLLSIAAWMRINLLAPFKQGDRIEIGGVHGDVIDIRLLRTTLMETNGWVEADQSTGRMVHVPNSWLFEHALYNHSRGFSFIWNEVSVTLTFRSDWEAARAILEDLAQQSASIIEHQAKQEMQEMSREFLVHYSILTPFVYVRVTEHGVRLTLRYLCEVRKRRGTEHALAISMLRAFKDHGRIEFAYPMVGVATAETPQYAEVPQARRRRRGRRR